MSFITLALHDVCQVSHRRHTKTQPKRHMAYIYEANELFIQFFEREPKVRASLKRGACARAIHRTATQREPKFTSPLCLNQVDLCGADLKACDEMYATIGQSSEGIEALATI